MRFAAVVCLIASIAAGQDREAIDAGKLDAAALRTALGHPDAAIRWRAAWQLALAPDAAAVPALLALLDDADDSARFAAEVALSRMPADPGLAELVSDRDAPPARRLAAVRALALSGSPAAVKPLRRALARAPKKMRPEFVRAIGLLGPPAIPLLLREIDEVALQPAIADALYRIGPEARRALEEASGKGSNNRRWGVDRARDRFREDDGNAASGWPAVRGGVARLVEALADLERQRHPPSSLPDITLREKEWTVREVVALASNVAENSPRDEAIPVLIRMTKDPDARIVEAGTLGLAKVKYLSAFSLLVGLVRGPTLAHDQDLRVVRIRKDAKIRGAQWADREIERLMPRFRKEIAALRATAAWGLARLGVDKEEARAALAAATGAEDAQVRRSAAAALWALGHPDEELRDSAEAALRDATWAWHIEEMAGRFGVEFTGALLPYPAAVVALGEPAIPLLAKHLQADHHAAEVLAALAAFGPLAATAATEAVLDASLDPALERKAFAALAAMGEAAHPILKVELLHDDSVRVRYQAARVLGVFE